MDSSRSTTAAVEVYLHELAGARGDDPVEPIVRALLAKSIDRLGVLCSTMLYGSYPRLTRPPMNLRSDEMLGALVERLMKAMREARPQTVRQFFGLASQHIRWELNDLARRLDNQPQAVELRDSVVPAPAESSGGAATPNTLRILDAIEKLPEEEHEVFSLVRIQGLTQTEAAEIVGVSPKTIQRRLNRGLAILAENLRDLQSMPRDAEPL